MIATEIIKKKRNKKNLTFDELDFFIGGYTKGSIPDYQMSSLLMAILLNGMTPKETVDLTQVMLDSGVKVEFPKTLFPVDKHSTGGVGDKTSLILAPIVAACGIPVPMMSGRGLGHTGGTLDKLESIPGFDVSLDLETFKKMVEDTGLSYIGQTNNICPADKKIYSLRDVTATVESLPLICASIMSKKIAEGIKGLVLDVKVGSGAFMKTIEDGKALAQGLTQIGEGHGIVTQALLSNMNQPLGRFCGNSLEVAECLSILKREEFMGHDHKNFKDTEELSVELATRMISVAKKINVTEAHKEALQALDSGRAFTKFEEVCAIQKGKLNELPLPTQKKDVVATTTGWVESFNTESIGVAGICLGAGRKQITDKINPVTGIEVHKKVGDAIEVGEPIFSIHFKNKNQDLDETQKRLQASLGISQTKVSAETLLFD